MIRTNLLFTLKYVLFELSTFLFGFHKFGSNFGAFKKFEEGLRRIWRFVKFVQIINRSTASEEPMRRQMGWRGCEKSSWSSPPVPLFPSPPPLSEIENRCDPLQPEGEKENVERTFQVVAAIPH